eukprot:13457016-Heterocapsa_arctica.AAC.1
MATMVADFHNFRVAKSYRQQPVTITPTTDAIHTPYSPNDHDPHPPTITRTLPVGDDPSTD